MPAAFGIDATESRGNDARIVQDKDVAGAQVIEQVAEVAVGDLSSFAVKNEEPGLIAMRSGCLRDKVLGQVEIKVTCEHVVNNSEAIGP